MKRTAFFLLYALGTLFASAQQSVSFSVASMNVDGLPAKILFWDINPDGPGSDGSKLISQKLSTKDYDLIAFSEDFNYHGSLMSAISDRYYASTHRGSISITSLNYPFNTDGLCLLWKNIYTVGDESWTQWSTFNGTTSNGNDGLIRKGFRHYVFTPASDIDIDVFILHMDAESDPEDIAARESQWEQLTATILEQYDNNRPKIVMGDTNSRYTREHIRTLFMNPIEATGRYAVGDPWVEFSRNGVYPTYGSWSINVADEGWQKGEIVDKVFYINPVAGAHIKAESYLVDTDFNKDDGTPLADHYPVVVRFTAETPYFDTTISTSRHNTIFVPFRVKVPEGVTAYYATRFEEDEKIYLQATGNSIFESTCAVIYAQKTGTYRFLKTDKTTHGPKTNLLTGTDRPLKGSDRDPDMTYYTVSRHSNGAGFYRITNTTTIPIFSAFLQKPTSENPAFSYAFANGIANSIEAPATQTDAEEGVTMYDLTGRRTQHTNTASPFTPSGIYLLRTKDGQVRKVLVR